MPRYVTMVSNNDGGHPAIIHDSLDAAKQWVRDYLTDPDNDPPPTPEELSWMESELAQIEDWSHVWSIRGSQAWKEWIYIADLQGVTEGQ